jgi:alkylation response protein AidB-like acyl-CoA dehydrogenase
MATGEMRAAFSMSEPDLGSDVAAIRTAARPDGDDYVISGQKMWLTNGASARLVALLARTSEGATRPHRNLTAFLIEKESGFGQTRPGLTVTAKIPKMGTRESTPPGLCSRNAGSPPPGCWANSPAGVSTR